MTLQELESSPTLENAISKMREEIEKNFVSKVEVTEIVLKVYNSVSYEDKLAICERFINKANFGDKVTIWFSDGSEDLECLKLNGFSDTALLVGLADVKNKLVVKTCLTVSTNLVSGDTDVLKTWGLFLHCSIMNNVKNAITPVVYYDNKVMKVVDGCLTINPNFREKLTQQTYTVSENLRGPKLFKQFEKLKHIDLNQLDLSRIYDLDEAFSGNVETIDFGDKLFYAVKSMNRTFGYCTHLKRLNLFDAEFDELESMNAMCRGCTELEVLNLHSINTQYLKDVRYMCEGCSSLKLIVLNEWDLKCDVKTEGMFKGCTSLNEIYLRNCNDETISVIKSALNEAGLLNKVIVHTDIPSYTMCSQLVS